jgi:hypothetical protein
MMSLALLTASCDVILVLDVGGTLRFCQIMLFGVGVCALVQMLQTRRILWPRGGNAMALWCIFQAVLISQSPAPLGSLVFFLMLLFTIGSIASALQLYGRSPLVGSLMRIYLLSFVAVSAFGALQFILPLLHLGGPLVVQWLVSKQIPRINGFSYEPSYFATYLIMGWIMLIDLRSSKAAIVAERKWFWYLILVSLVLFLSTSKTAWLLMIVEGFARMLPGIYRRIRKQLMRLKQGSWIVDKPRGRVVLVLAGLAIVAFAGITAVSRVVDLNIFLSGTGLNGTAAHSLNDRISGFALTLQVIEDHFWIGRSLGGVPATIASMVGLQATTVAQLKTFWGFPVPLEVFAASGFWAFIPFLWFFVTITAGEQKLIRGSWDDDRAKWLQALIRALIFEWLALCADQNMLRAYLWLHVTMVVIVGYSLRFYRESQQTSPAMVTA